MRLRGGLAVVVCVAGMVGAAGPVQAADRRDQPGVLTVQTVPVIKGARVAADGNIATTNRLGQAKLPVAKFTDLATRFHVLETRVDPRQKVTVDKVLGDPEHGASGRPLVVGLRTYRLVRFAFYDRTGGAVNTRRISLLQLRSSTGEIVKLRGAALNEPLWVLASRTQQVPDGLVSKDIYWVVDRTVVNGAEVVNRAEHKFVPNSTITWTVKLLFYRVEVEARDALFGFPTGREVSVVGPDGKRLQAKLRDGNVRLPLLPRGSYEVVVSGGGTSFRRPVSISKDQTLDLAVLSYLDIAMIAGTLVLTALSLLLLGRRRHLKAALARHRHRRRRRPRTPATATASSFHSILLVAALASASGLGAAGPATTGLPGTTARAGYTKPVLAYYYIWFQPTSWQRAKSDFPLLGNYSSDDVQVMRAHVRLAKAAGITGFLVSWKHLPHLDHRLAQLATIADEMDFSLGIVYQGLDFHRDPLPAKQVGEELRYFADQYSTHPSFHITDKPLVVWTGTGEFTADQVRAVVDPVRSRLSVLGSAKSVVDYERIADLVEGNAYYWSSVDPDVDKFHASKLAQMGAAVHAHDGYWIAPAAPGYDARLLGGDRVVARDGGRTLRRELAAAEASAPDAVGLISWNEFSENSHVEPSEKYGDQSIQALAAALGVRKSVDVPARPDAKDDSGSGLTGLGAVVLLLLSLALINVLVAYRRPGRRSVEPAAPQLLLVPPDKTDRPPRMNRNATSPHHENHNWVEGKPR